MVCLPPVVLVFVLRIWSCLRHWYVAQLPLFLWEITSFSAFRHALHNYILFALMAEVCMSCSWPKLRTERYSKLKKSKNWREGSLWHRWPATPSRGQMVKPLRWEGNFVAEQLVCFIGTLMSNEILCIMTRKLWAPAKVITCRGLGQQPHFRLHSFLILSIYWLTIIYLFYFIIESYRKYTHTHTHTHTHTQGR